MIFSIGLALGPGLDPLYKVCPHINIDQTHLTRKPKPVKHLGDNAFYELPCEFLYSEEGKTKKKEDFRSIFHCFI